MLIMSFDTVYESGVFRSPLSYLFNVNMCMVLITCFSPENCFSLLDALCGLFILCPEQLMAVRLSLLGQVFLSVP